MGCKICNIYRISFTELITNDELKSFNPMMLQAEIQKIVKANPEKHSRMSKQVWLYPDRSKDKVFAEVQKRWATDTRLECCSVYFSWIQRFICFLIYLLTIYFIWCHFQNFQCCKSSWTSIRVNQTQWFSGKKYR